MSACGVADLPLLIQTMSAAPNVKAALPLLGLDHERLSFYPNGIARRLTDVLGHVIPDILEETARPPVR